MQDTELSNQVRVALSSGTEIPIPSASFETVDYKNADDYAEDSEKDTPAKQVYAYYLLFWCVTV